MAVRSSGFSVGRLSASWGVSDMTSLFEIPQTSVDSYSGAADYLGARPAAEKANLDLMRAMCGTRFRGKADDGGPPQTFSPAETSRATTSRWRPCFSAAIGPAIDGKERRVLREYALRVVDERIRAQRMEINLPLFAPSCVGIVQEFARTIFDTPGQHQLLHYRCEKRRASGNHAPVPNRSRTSSVST